MKALTMTNEELFKIGWLFGVNSGKYMTTIEYKEKSKCMSGLDMEAEMMDDAYEEFLQNIEKYESEMQQ